MAMDIGNDGWFTTEGPGRESEPQKDPTAPYVSPSGLTSHAPAPTAVFGNGGTEHVAGLGIRHDTPSEYGYAPSADLTTGFVMTTPSGGPVPPGGPRPTDLVHMHGTTLEVRTAINMGWMPDVTSTGGQIASAMMRHNAPHQANNARTASAPAAAGGDGRAEGTYGDGDDDGDSDRGNASADASADADAIVTEFSNHILPNISPQGLDGLRQDIAEGGNFTSRSLDYLRLEGRLSDGDMEAVRSSYMQKATAATGLTEGELEAVYNGNRAAFTDAVMEMVQKGSTEGLRKLCAYVDASMDAYAQNDAGAYEPLSMDHAAEAWRSADFPQALIDAGLEPIFSTDSGELHVNIPGRGAMAWADAVRQGVVKVSRLSA